MKLQENVSLKDFSNYQIGGPARYFADVGSIKDLKNTIKKGKELGVPIFVLGGGTNILWSDDGFDGLVIKLSFESMKVDGTNVTAGAGVPMDRLVNYASSNGLTGFEWAGGLPGSFGGAVFGNAGAFSGEIKDIIVSVTSLDTETLEMNTRTCKECDFGYRISIFKASGGKEIILEATLKLEKGDKNEIQKNTQEKIDYREEKHPIELPNIGSIFKNVAVEGLSKEVVDPHRDVIKTDPFPVIPTAYLIDQVGLKGERIGGAQISPKHPNFIVNLGGAKAKDVLGLIELVKEKVNEKLGIQLEEEVRIIK